MANALKCDRCGSYFDYDPSAKFNFIAFGHKDIVIGKNFPVKDICPNCMEKFIDWLENPFDPETCKSYLNEETLNEIKEEEDNLTSLMLCNRENCKGCKDFGWVNDSKDAEAAWGYYTCNMMNKKVKNPYIESAFGALMLTPKKFFESDDIFRDDDERVNELYKEAEDISNSAGEEKVE